MKEYVIGLLGDPIEDIYYFGNIEYKGTVPRFVISSEDRRQGGCNNVLQNLYAFVRQQSGSIRVVTNCYPAYNHLKILRYITKGAETPFLEVTLEADKTRKPDLIWQRDLLEESDSLILSDYNKGELNSSLGDETKLPQKYFDFIVVDSRYGTIHKDYLKLKTHLRVLHATLNEIDLHSKEDYNYTIHTQGAGPVLVYQGSQLISELPVPKDTPVVDTTGAGDTFTASLGAYLAINKPTQPSDILTATKLAIGHCQQVVQHFGCVVPSNILLF